MPHTRSLWIEDHVASSGDFYGDRRYCAHCQTYVQYLLSPKGAHCLECDRLAELFSPEDQNRFREGLRRPGMREPFVA